MNFRFSFFRKLFLLLLGVNAVGGALAATCTWNGVTGNWSVASNWSCGAVPSTNAANTVVINSGNVQIGAAGTAFSTPPASYYPTQSVTVNGGTLTLLSYDIWGNDPTSGLTLLTVNNGGTLASSNSFNVLTNPVFTAGSTLLANGGVYATYGSFHIKGTVASSGTVNFTAGTGSNNQMHVGDNATNTFTNFNVSSGVLTVGVPLANATDLVGVAVATGIVKQGSGTMAMTDTSTYSHNTTVSGGTLQIGTGSTTGDISSTSAVSVASGATLAFNRSNDYSFGKTITGAGALSHIGSGTTTLTGPNTYSGGTTVSSGHLVLQNSPLSSMAGPTTVSSGATLTFKRTVAGAVNGTFFNQTVSGAGNLVVDDGLGGSGINGGWHMLYGITSLTGSITVKSGVFGTAGLSSANWTSNTADVTVNTGGVFTHRANSIQIGGLNGTGDVAAIWNGQTTQVLSIGAGNKSGSFSGVIHGKNSGADFTIDAGVTNIAKIGTGTQTLSGANTYSGTTTVSGGQLNINGNQSAATGAVTVATGGTLGGTGTVGGATTVQSGGTLSPGLSPGTLSFGSGLTLASGSVSNFELAQAGTAGGSCNDLVAVTGNLTLGGTLNVSATTGASGCSSTFGVGTYTLFTFTGTRTGDFSAITLPSGFAGRIDYSVANQVRLVVVVASTLTYWDVAANGNNNAVNGGTGTWDTSTTNWTNSGGTVNGTWPAGTSVATFAGTAGTVTVSGTQSAGGLTFNTTGYTVSGGTLNLSNTSNPVTVSTGTATVASTLTGSSGLLKSGAGSLVLGSNVSPLPTPNTGLTGGLIVSQGTVYANEINAIGPNGTNVVLGDANTGSSSLGLLYKSGIIASGSGPFVNANVTVSSNVTGTATLGFYDTGFKGNYSEIWGTLTVNGPLTVYDGSRDRFTTVGKITGSGPITVTGTRFNPRNNGVTSDYTGTVTVTSGSQLQIADSVLLYSDIVNNGSFKVFASLPVGALSGSGSTAAYTTGTVVSQTLTVGNNNHSGVYSGSLQDNNSKLNLAKQGTGTQTLSGTNTYTGTTAVSAGTLVVTGSTSNSSATTVASGATLAGTGTVGGASTISGNLTPGVSAPGTLSFNNNLTLASGASTSFELAQAGTAGGSCNDLVAVTGNLTMGGALTVSSATGASGCSSTFGPGTYTLFTYTGTQTGSFSSISLPAGYTGRIDTSVAGQVRLILITTSTYWDIAANGNNNVVNGGTGTWDASTANWTDSGGVLNSSWAGDVAVATFKGTAGTVTVSGTQSAGGLTFNTTGYALTGGTITGAASTNPITVSTGSVTVGSVLAGSNAFTKEGTGYLTLSGANTYTGTTTVNGGRLFVTGSTATGSAVTMASGTVLGGTGTVGGNTTVNAGAYLMAGVGGNGTLSFGSNLTLASSSSTEFSLGQAGTPGGSCNDLYNVVGNLTLGGFLEVAASTGSCAGTFGSGTYRLFNYSGTLSGAFTGNVFMREAGYFGLVDTSTPGQVNLIVSNTGYWDGANTTANSVVDGGTGTWNSSSANWTNMGGTSNTAWPGGAAEAIFIGTAGIVTVSGTRSAGALTFNVPGYTLSGGSITGGSSVNPITVSTGTTTVGSVLAGSNAFSKLGAGTLALTGANTYTGATTVSTGTLAVTGSTSAGSAVTVASGATLRGTGTVGGSTTVNGYLSAGGGISGTGLLTFGSSLTLGSGANTQMWLAQTATAGGSCNDFFSVGNLTLGGTLTINKGDAFSGCGSTFGMGTYRLFNYSGALSGSFGSVSLPVGLSGAIDTSTPGQVNLVVSSANYWDGGASGNTSNGVVNGGDGTWDSSSANWTSSTGAGNGRWGGGTTVPIFQGTAGTVTVSGTQSMGGMNFNVTGYTVSGGTLTGAAATNPMSVSTGTATATVGSVLAGSNAFTKVGAGTLVFNGANTYTGSTTVSTGTLQAGVNAALPAGNAVTVASAATLDVNGTTQSLASLSSAGTLALGSNGQLTLTSGASSVAAVTGSGKIIVGPGATLTLTQSLTNSGVAIELAGGTLQLGAGLTHSLGALTVTATGSTLDFASAGNVSATFSSVDASSGAALAVTNWTTGADLFAATAVVGSPARSTVNLAPLNRITFTTYPASNTNWRVSQNEITPILPNPQLRVALLTNGGTGTFNYTLANLSAATQSLTTATAGVAVQSAVMTGTTGLAATITQSGVPSGWSSIPLSASCVDSLGSSNGNGTASFGSLAGAVLTVPLAKMVQGSDIVCTFTNTLNSSISGKVFNDGGAPSAGVNTGTPNNGVQDGSEAGLAGVAVSLNNCGTTTHASTTTDATGAYSLSVPSAQLGQAVCVSVALSTGQLATGANAGGAATPTPDGTPTTVGAVAYSYSRSQQRQSFTAPSSGALVLNFGQVPVSTLVSNSSMVGAPGNFVTHSHRFTAGTGGGLNVATLAATAVPATLTGWSEGVYLDAGCTGTYQAGASVLASSTVVQGQVVCFVVREFVPGGALNGNSNSVPVQAQLGLTNASPALSLSYSVTDVTTVSSAAVSLQKQVRNLTTEGSNAAWSTGNQAKTGDVMEYQITFTNTSAAPVTDVVVQDGTNNWTTWVSATAPTVPSGLTCKLNTPANPAPAAGQDCSPAVTGSGKGNVTWTFTGQLAPAATGSVTFKVTVD
ncbi:MAG: autotransporter-associated beta strand repeat-containing protein [Limnohabitans sp.]